MTPNVNSDSQKLEPSENVAASFCTTLVNQWADMGTNAAFAAPGSRSTPMLLALDNNDDINLHMFIDERSASFAALGYARANDECAILLCTSGTAAANFYPAIIEARLSGVPLLVCTADRPAELKQTWSPQTIDQNNLYGKHVKYFHNFEVPTVRSKNCWSSLAARLYSEARSCPCGPTHANMEFAKPLVGIPTLVSDKSATALTHVQAKTPSEETIANIINHISDKKGIIFAGRSSEESQAIKTLAEKLNWPLIANHQSGCRVDDSVWHYNQIFDEDPKAFSDCEVILHFGEPSSSKSFNQWLSNIEAITLGFTDGRWMNPNMSVDIMFSGIGYAEKLIEANIDFAPVADSWAAQWQSADKKIRGQLAEQTHNRNQSWLLANEIVDMVPNNGALVTSSSLPVRDIEDFGKAREDIEVFANRGANGIDGVIATAIGTAIAKPTLLYIGDIAFLHDISSLALLKDRSIDLTIAVYDNGGGKIFSRLPQAQQLDSQQFIRLFETPPNHNLSQIASSFGLEIETHKEIKNLLLIKL